MTTLRADLDRLPDRIAVKLLPQGDCWIWIGCVAGSIRRRWPDEEGCRMTTPVPMDPPTPTQPDEEAPVEPYF